MSGKAKKPRVAKDPYTTKKHGAVKYKYKEKPKQSFTYQGLTVEKEWPVRHEELVPLYAVGNPSFTPGSVVHIQANIPHNELWA